MAQAFDSPMRLRVNDVGYAGANCVAVSRPRRWFKWIEKGRRGARITIVSAACSAYVNARLSGGPAEIYVFQT